MPEDSRLTDFVDEAMTDETRERSASNGEHTPSSSAPPSTGAGEADAGRSALEAGVSTYAWGCYTCAACEADVNRVWRAESTYVCEQCTNW